MLDEKAPVALYYQLKNVFIDKIKTREWPINSKIPTERELCSIFNVSRITVRQALSELEKEGYIYRKQGRGTFVTQPKIEHKLQRFYSFSEEINNMGFMPSSKVLTLELEKPSEEISRQLILKEDEKIYKLIRIRFADKEPFALETSYLRASVCPDLQIKDLVGTSLYNLLREKYNLEVNQGEETFEAVLIDKDNSALLGVKPGTPGLFLTRTAGNDKQVVEYCKSLIRGDRFKYRIQLK